MVDDNLVEVATYTYQSEAQAAMVLLDNNNIKSEISDAGIVNAHAFLSNAVGGVKLFVAKDDYKKAYELIEEVVKERKEEYGKTCYYCESNNVVKNPVTWKTILLGILTLGIYFPGAFKHFKCNDCGKKLSHFVIN